MRKRDIKDLHSYYGIYLFCTNVRCAAIGLITIQCIQTKQNNLANTDIYMSHIVLCMYV